MTWDHQITRSTASILPYTPAVVAAIQAAHIEASTGRRRAIELVKEGAHAVRSKANSFANSVRNAEFHAVPAVAGARPPLRTDIHFWTAPVNTMIASTIMIVVQIVRIQPSVCRAALAPTANG